MENGGNLFGQGSRGHNGNNSNNSPNLAWDLWDFGTTFNDATTSTTSATAATSAAVATITLQETSAAHALMMFPHNFNNVDYFNHHQPPLLYGGSATHLHPDPHLTCLKLGKRQYFEDAIVSASSGNLVGDRHVEVSGFSINGKRGRAYYSDVCGTSSSSAAVPATMPRCQVDGCHVALVNAKDYHRRHKVCEMHSKSPKVVVLGVEQRFCQQCSRFHAIAEFDDSKRSCRRRLAGHNERRRKSSHDSTAKNPSQDNKLMVGRYPYLASQTGRALSLLSSANKADSDHHHSWVSSADLSSRSSAALRELIAENRAAILAGQLILDNRDWHWHGHHAAEEINGAPTGSISHSYHHQLYNIEPPGLGLDRYHEHGRQITLDLMQASSSAFGMLSMRGKSKEEVEECSQLWNSLQGSHVV